MGTNQEMLKYHCNCSGTSKQQFEVGFAECLWRTSILPAGDSSQSKMLNTDNSYTQMGRFRNQFPLLKQLKNVLSDLKQSFLLDETVDYIVNIF